MAQSGIDQAVSQFDLLVTRRLVASSGRHALESPVRSGFHVVQQEVGLNRSAPRLVRSVKIAPSPGTTSRRTEGRDLPVDQI